MEKILSVFLIALLALTVLAVTGVLLFRYFAADQIMENGGTMNPDDMDETETPMILDKLDPQGNSAPMQQSVPQSWICPSCGAQNSGKFCESCGAKRP